MIKVCKRCGGEYEGKQWLRIDDLGKVVPEICPHCGEPNKPKLHRKTPIRYQ